MNRGSRGFRMLKDNWLERQLATVKELLETGQQHVKDNSLVQAEASLKEAAIILDSAESVTSRVLKMRFVVFNELAMIAGRTHDGNGALNNYLKALKALDALEEPASLERVTILVNLGGVYAAGGRLAESEAASRRAIEILDGLKEPNEHARLMKLFASYHLGAALHAGVDPATAYAPLCDAVEAGETLGPQALQTAKPLIIECLGRLAHLAALSERFAEAIERETKASVIALELHEQSRETSYLNAYANGLLRLINYCEAGGRFALAEDAIFKLLGMFPKRPEVIARGKKFYHAILALSDEALEGGDLPRDEAEESLKELETL